jgi:hypothetical protein
MHSHKFNLDNNYSIKIERNDEGKHIYLIDNILGITKLIGTINNSCKWVFATPNIQQDFFKLVKKYKNIFKNNFNKSLEDTHEITLDKQFNCFRRRMHIKVGRTLNKLKHVI